MQQALRILRYRLSQLVRDRWLLLAVAASGGVWLLQGTDVFAHTYSGHGVASAYLYRNLAMPFVMVLFSVVHFHALKERRASELMDSMPVSNASLYMATFTSLVAFFLAIELVQYSLVVTAVSLLTKIERPLDYWYLLTIVVPDTLFYIGLGACLGVAFRDIIPAVVIGFLLEVANKLQYTNSFQGWGDILNTYGVTKHSQSDFPALEIDKELMSLNRLFFLGLAALLVAIGVLCFKRNRQRRAITPLRGAVVVATLASCVFIVRSYGSIKTIPATVERARISDYLISGRSAQTAGPGATEYSAQRTGLEFGRYQVEGSITRGVLQATASFRVTNSGPDPMPLAFFLADGLEVRSVAVSGEGVPFKRDGVWWSVDCPPIPVGADMDCHVSYRGRILEYAKDIHNPPLLVLHKLCGYTGDSFAVLPSSVGWYPMVASPYSYALGRQEEEWLIPQSDLKTADFSSDIDADIAAFSHGRFVIAYPGLTTETLDGIKYVYLHNHRPLVHEFHRSIKDRLLFYQELIPLDITVVETPNLHITSDAGGATYRQENGNGLIIIGEGTLSALASKTDHRVVTHVTTTLWSGWLSQPPQRLPGGGEDHSIFVTFGQLMEYLYQLGGSEEAAEAFANEYKDNPLLGVMIEYYNNNGLERTQELLRALHARERERGLKQDDYAELMGIRFVVLPQG